MFDDYFLELLLRIHKGCYFLGALLGTNLDFSLADLAVVVVIDISEVGDIHRSVVSLLETSLWVKFQQIACGFPEEVHFRIQVDRLKNSDFEPIFAAFLELRQVHVEGRVLFLNFAFIAELPKVQQLVLPFLIRC